MEKKKREPTEKRLKREALEQAAREAGILLYLDHYEYKRRAIQRARDAERRLGIGSGR
jgi:hypothetical protein